MAGADVQPAGPPTRRPSVERLQGQPLRARLRRALQQNTRVRLLWRALGENRKAADPGRSSPNGGAGRKCLDFACGTGRIANVAAGLFGEVVGADISRPMLDCAQVPPNVRLRHIDMTREPLGETFDVVTAFRFFLNAEDQLKSDALKAINEHLKDGGRLVCNVHMNATSPIGLVCRLLNRLSGRTIRHTLSTTAFKELLTASGFRVEEMTPYGYLPRPGNLLPGVCGALIEPFEKVSRTLRVPGQLAQHFLVVAKKR
ncbi:class I SAM-dependent methyltransferase [Mesorhizobium huakuii]|uniref:class I SAM-dependent methyltransferase n=1 Tax=Mesorhizobium huakuii TaxID=28104 RepID=UPI0032AFAD05